MFGVQLKDRDRGSIQTSDNQKQIRGVNMREQYEKDPDFREYVNRYSVARQITVDEALTHELIKGVADYYKGMKHESK